MPRTPPDRATMSAVFTKAPFGSIVSQPTRQAA
jgi:hypothetical protein